MTVAIHGATAMTVTTPTYHLRIWNLSRAQIPCRHETNLEPDYPSHPHKQILERHAAEQTVVHTKKPGRILLTEARASVYLMIKQQSVNEIFSSVITAL